jgi:hypothetical protein
MIIYKGGEEREKGEEEEEEGGQWLRETIGLRGNMTGKWATRFRFGVRYRSDTEGS